MNAQPKPGEGRGGGFRAEIECSGAVVLDARSTEPIVTLAEFLDKIAVPDRTFRSWVQHGLMPQSDNGHYTDAHLLRALAICRLREEEGMREFRDLAARLDAMTPAQLEAFATGEPIDEATDGAVESTAEASPSTDPTGLAMTEGVRESWTHLTLRPGLVLAIREGVDEEARGLAQSIASLSGIDASID
jgi:hypothetical protein